MNEGKNTDCPSKNNDAEIKELIYKAQNGDKSAKEALVTQNSPLVWSIVKKYRGRLEAEDLYQIGVIGLLKCIEKFDLKYDVRFSTYAVPMIMGEIKRFLRDDGIIKVSRPLKELNTKAKYAAESFSAKNNREPSLSELAEILSVDTEELVQALDSSKEVESLFSEVYRDSPYPTYLGDKISGSSDDLLEKLNIKEAVRSLPERERKIIELRYFQDETQQQVAKKLGISQVQVSRIEKKVLSAMRKKL